MADTCRLREHNGIVDVHCEREECVYWRVVGHLGVVEQGQGCAIQHFQLLDGGGEIAAWLPSVKERYERPVSGN